MTLVCVAIPSLFVMAQVATDGGVLELLSKGGAVGVLAFLLWYVVTKQMPAMEQRHTDTLKDQRQSFDAAIEKIIQAHTQDRAAHADEIREVLLSRGAGLGSKQ